MADVDLTVAGTLGGSLIEHVARQLVVAVDVGNVILTITYLALLRAIHRI